MSAQSEGKGTGKGTGKDGGKVLEKIATWPGEQRAVGERLHEIVLESAPGLRPKLYYGAPGYALDGPVILFFRVDDGLMSLGLTEKASFSDSDPLVEAAWFVNRLDEAAERRVAALVRSAAGVAA